MLVSRPPLRTLGVIGMGDVVSTPFYGVIQPSYYVDERVDKCKVERGRERQPPILIDKD